MSYEVEVSDEFRLWYEDTLDQPEQESVTHVVALLMEYGPALPFPYSSAIQGSRLSHLRELRVQHSGRPYRILYAFDPARSAFLLLGGEKTGDGRWYDRMVPQAERIYDQHLRELDAERRNR